MKVFSFHYNFRNYFMLIHYYILYSAGEMRNKNMQEMGIVFYK